MDIKSDETTAEDMLREEVPDDVPQNDLKQESAEELLREEVPDDAPQNDLKQESQKKTEPVVTLIKNVNNKVLIDFLSPEISINEKHKRIHKYILIALLSIFIIVQFFASFHLSCSVIKYATSDSAKIDIVKSLLTFVSAYITSVVVELIAILNYVVQHVFDTSIADLVKIFKETDNEEQEQDY